MMVYLCAGLYAEGPSDYRFLSPLITRLLHELSAAQIPGRGYVADTVGIDAPHKRSRRRREDRIAAAIDDAWGQCTLFVIHSDGAGDPEGARQSQIIPGLKQARATHGDLASAACIPVRELEAWMLADGEPFHKLGYRAPALPANPEAEPDPKATLTRLFKEIKPQMLVDSYRFFGENVRLDHLDRLPAFQAFRGELDAAIQVVARRPRGHGQA